jgi:hypothetical protein
MTSLVTSNTAGLHVLDDLDAPIGGPAREIVSAAGAEIVEHDDRSPAATSRSTTCMPPRSAGARGVRRAEQPNQGDDAGEAAYDALACPAAQPARHAQTNP